METQTAQATDSKTQGVFYGSIRRPALGRKSKKLKPRLKCRKQPHLLN